MNKVILGNAMDIQPVVINNDVVKNVEKRVMIGKKDGAPNFVMRLFTVGVGGCSPKHAHEWEHEVYILKGNAEVFDGEKYVAVKEGTYVFVPGGVEHQFRNAGDTEMQFICVIPTSAPEE